MKNKVIIVCGAKGQLGSELRVLSMSSHHTFIFSDIDTLDLTNKSEARFFFEKNKPDFIINCAAYTAVDKAEEEPQLAELLNAGIPELLGDFCTKNDCKLIHISTDYVFSGEGSTPLKEDDQTGPQSVYGKTKLQGEAKLKGNENALIIRTSWLYSAYGNNFVNSMLRYMKERDELRIVNDQFGTPTYAADLAEVILSLVDNAEQNFKPGIYHYSNEGATSWYEFTIAIKEITKASCKIIPITTKEYPLPAKRPKYSIFAKEKIKTQFKISIPDWKSSLEKYLRNKES